MASLMYAAVVTCALASTAHFENDEELVLLQRQASVSNGTLESGGHPDADGWGEKSHAQGPNCGSGHSCSGFYPCSNFYEDEKYGFGSIAMMSKPCCCNGEQKFANECNEETRFYNPFRVGAPVSERARKRATPGFPVKCAMLVHCGSPPGGYTHFTPIGGSDTLDKTGRYTGGLSCLRGVWFQGCKQVKIYDDDAHDWFSEDQHVTLNEANGFTHSENPSSTAGNSGKNCCKTAHRFSGDGYAAPDVTDKESWCKFTAPWDLQSDVKKIEYQACDDEPGDVPADEPTTNYPQC